MNISEKIQTPRLKIFGLASPLAGALLGILVFLLILLPIKLLQANSLILSFIRLDLELLGRMTISALSGFAGFDLSENISGILSVVISAIPPGILGWLIGSYMKLIRVAGIVLSVMYLCLILAVGTLLTSMAI